MLPPDVCCDSFPCHIVVADVHVLTLNKNLLAQPLLDAAGGSFYASAGAETHHLVYLLPGPWQVRELAQGCGEKMTN